MFHQSHEHQSRSPMADVLLFWRDYRKNMRRSEGILSPWWYSNAQRIGKLAAGDRLWFVTSGSCLGETAAREGFLVAVARVSRVLANPGNDPAYSPQRFRFRAELDPSELAVFEPAIAVDAILRPPGRSQDTPIGRFLQGPRTLSEEKVRLLESAAEGRQNDHRDEVDAVDALRRQSPSEENTK